MSRVGYWFRPFRRLDIERWTFNIHNTAEWLTRWNSLISDRRWGSATNHHRGEQLAARGETNWPLTNLTRIGRAGIPGATISMDILLCASFILII